MRLTILILTRSSGQACSRPESAEASCSLGLSSPAADIISPRAGWLHTAHCSRDCQLEARKKNEEWGGKIPSRKIKEQSMQEENNVNFVSYLLCWCFIRLLIWHLLWLDTALHRICRSHNHHHQLWLISSWDTQEMVMTWPIIDQWKHPLNITRPICYSCWWQGYNRKGP